MIKLTQTASALTLAMALSAAPLAVMAQTTPPADSPPAVVTDPPADTAMEPEVPIEDVEGTIVMQDENSILASDLIGATVYNAADEAVGDINDAIISLDGTVEGVVIGVGGFLGLGQKRVAIELQQISLQADEDGDPRLILDTTRESLQAAPDFVTAAEQQAAVEQQQMQEAPATGLAPATEPAAPTN